MTYGISHITLICQDLNKTASFLQYIFGAREIYSSEAKTFSIAKQKFFKVGELWLAIMESKHLVEMI